MLVSDAIWTGYILYPEIPGERTTFTVGEVSEAVL